MLPLIAEQLALGLAMIVSAFFFGQWLYAKGRRDPESVLVNASLLADFVCVFEVILIVLGTMLLLRAVLFAF